VIPGERETMRAWARFSKLGRITGCLWALLLVAGCAVKLAPAYDNTIVTGLTKANEETSVLFASVAAGTTKDTFSNREDSYNKEIGAFDALRIQAIARPTPSAPIGGTATQIPRLQAPTANVLTEIRDTLIRMRDTDKRAGLSSTQVVGFKQSYEISIDQALTYEKALQR